MNRIYSIILLVSFMAGVIYPVTPMVEYVMSDSKMCEILSHCSCNDVDNRQTACDCCDTKKPDELLDLDNYPIPFNVKAETPVGILSELKEKFFPTSERTINFYTLPLSPPPRIS